MYVIGFSIYDVLSSRRKTAKKVNSMQKKIQYLNTRIEFVYYKIGMCHSIKGMISNT